MTTVVASPLGAKRARESDGHGKDGVLAQGAEGTVKRISFLGRDAVVKERFSKAYRHPELDKRLTERRLSKEVKTMLRCRKLGIPTPSVYFVDAKKSRIYMEYLHRAVTLKDFLKEKDADISKVFTSVGAMIARLHDGNVVHGDLTTSNLMLRENDQVVMIDFGLSYISGAEEDKAVDLYVLERAVSSAHADIASQVNDRWLQSYRTASRQSKAVLRRLDEVRLRGRKRVMIG